MNPERERAQLQAAIDFLNLSSRELAAWAPRSNDARMLEAKALAVRVLRERLHELNTELGIEGESDG